jgi:adenylate kinase
MDKGEVVSDSLILGMMEIRFKDADCKKGFILDGFPRTITQAKGLDVLLDKINQELNYVILINVNDNNMAPKHPKIWKPSWII